MFLISGLTYLFECCVDLDSHNAPYNIFTDLFFLTLLLRNIEKLYKSVGGDSECRSVPM